MMISSEQSRNRLTHLRGVAILFVILCHFNLEGELLGRVNLSDPFFTGVELFFLLSGYGIAASVIHSDSWITFAQKRVKRIAPSLLAFLLVCYLFNCVFKALPLSDWAMEAYVRSDVDQIMASIRVLTGTYILDSNGPFGFGAIWYLSVQMWFYVLVMLAFIPRAQDSAMQEKLRRKSLLVLSLLMAVPCMAARLSVLAGHSLSNGILCFILGWKFDIPFWGVLLYFIAEKLGNSENIRVTYHRVWTVVLLAIPLIVLTKTGSALSTVNDNPLLTGLGYPTCVLFYGLLILYCNVGEQTSIPHKNKFLSYFETRSYPLFLFNFLGLQTAWLVISYACPWVFYAESTLCFGSVQFLLGSLFTIAFAEADYRLVELPRKRAKDSGKKGSGGRAAV